MTESLNKNVGCIETTDLRNLDTVIWSTASENWGYQTGYQTEKGIIMYFVFYVVINPLLGVTFRVINLIYFEGNSLLSNFSSFFS